MWTIIAVIIWNGNIVAEDFGYFDNPQHCQKVAIELNEKLKKAGTDVVSVCVPADSTQYPLDFDLPEGIRG
jgi:SepF-like predicted cell division protein (DUF552 family)